MASPRREFPIFELQNGVKYEFVPSVELQYNEFKWQVGRSVGVVVGVCVCVVLCI